MNEKKTVYPSNEKEYFFVAEMNAKIIGCGGYYLPKNSSLAKMAWGMVHSRHHKKGFGRHLLTFRIQEIGKEAPSRSIELDTSQHTYRFFEKLGFKVVKISENGYGTGLHRYDMVKKMY
jgi:ribosomal protein S18 acetylase RimI-like enzyme